MKGIGGDLEAFCFAFGDDDLVVTIDLLDGDGVSAIALSLDVTSGRAFRPTITVVITPEEID